MTSGMRDFFQGQTWILPDGSEFTWIAPEHCVVLIGEDEKYYYVHDPQVGADVPYRKEDCERAFEALSCQVLYLEEQ